MKSTRNTKVKKSSSPKKSKESFLVAIGASAGGLEAVSELLQHLPTNTGMAFIYVQHLSPDHPSSLALLLSKSTKMKVKEAANMMLIEPNHVYVCKPNKEILVTDGKMKLVPRHDEKIPYLPINNFFISLAQNHKKKLIGIIFSGNATDGTQGLKAIKKAGGITFAQDHTAKYNSMPASAINEGAADYILSPKEIAKELIKLSKNISLERIRSKTKEDTIRDNDPYLNTIFEILNKSNGVDFSHYKMSTVKRRIHRRMRKHSLKTIKEYVNLLKKDRKEAELLYNDLLINVTSFFRDTEIFRYLKTTFLPKLLKDKKEDETLRIWIPACSSGEEAYSIAMLITEIQDKQKTKIPVKIFATDLSEQIIDEARTGEYSESDLQSFSSTRIKRFFTRVNGNYRISKHLRELCIFVTHNILRDPPFSRMDLISCRNLLIYFDAAAQKKVIATFHFALNDGGYLLLGKSETIETSSQLFTQINSNYNIYSRKKNSDIRKQPELEPRLLRQVTGSGGTILKNSSRFPFPAKRLTSTANSLDAAIDSELLSNFMPACAVINKNMEILQFRGSTSLFLSHPSGKASLNILKMIRPEFAFELRDAINKVLRTKKPVKKSDIEIKLDSFFRKVSLEVSSLKVEWDEPLLLVVFTLHEQEENQSFIIKDGKNDSTQKDRKIKKLTEELNTAASEMQTYIESQESAYEELQTANEEIVSSNEEFQTLNEELESTKEEIEAANEELISTNQELQKRNELLTESDNYSEAIIATIHEPMLVLNKNLSVKSASKSFYTKFKVNKEETEGMHLFELGNNQWDIPKLRKLLNDILAKNTHFENFEVTHKFPDLGEKIMLLNANRIIQKTHGEQLILLAIEDITERSHYYLAEKEILNKDIRFHKAGNEELEKAVRSRTKELEKKNKELEKANKKLAIQNEEREKRAAELSIANKELAFQNNEKEKRAKELIIANKELAFQNNEKEKRAEELSIANKDLTSFTYVTSHDLQEPLRKIQNFVTIIVSEEEANLSENGKAYFKRMRETAKRMQALIEDLLTYSRTKSGERIFEMTNLNSLLKDVIKDFEETIEEKKAIIESTKLCNARVIPFQFRQLMHNLISNSLKFAKPDSHPHIIIKTKIIKGNKLNKLPSQKRYCHLALIDKGIGFEPQYKDRIFEVFQRLHSVEEYNGTGIGLAICKRIVENHNGIITATGKLKKGVQFDIYIPAE